MPGTLGLSLCLQKSGNISIFQYFNNLIPRCLPCRHFATGFSYENWELNFSGSQTLLVYISFYFFLFLIPAFLFPACSTAGARLHYSAFVLPDLDVDGSNSQLPFPLLEVRNCRTQLIYGKGFRMCCLKGWFCQSSMPFPPLSSQEQLDHCGKIRFFPILSLSSVIPQLPFFQQLSDCFVQWKSSLSEAKIPFPAALRGQKQDIYILTSELCCSSLLGVIAMTQPLLFPGCACNPTAGKLLL